ncbi:Phosphoheptose isomerase [subsurface metagenome]
METKGMGKVIREILTETLELKKRTLGDPTLLDEIEKVASVIVQAYRRGNKLILFGNGGSAADAQHVAAEMVNKFELERDAIPTIALTTDTSILTSVANDDDFSHIFARQLEALVSRGDVAVAISTSGNSLNVLEGVRVAKERGATTVGFTGMDGGRLVKLVDLVLRAPSEKTPRIQELHITFFHIICHLVETELFSTRNS